MQKIPDVPAKIIDTLMKNGYEAYLVGGCVRDMLLGKTPADFDITTNALPDQIKALFEKTVDTGIEHGTVTVVEKGETVEVTTYRSDGDYSDMRRPEKVSFVSMLDEDLSRRDFTVNAMAYNEREGIVDIFGGKKDLENRLLRAVGDPEKRFSEDALRIMRLFRFSAVLGFDIEEKTRLAAKKLCKNLKYISGERIWSELSKILISERPDALRDIISSGGLESFSITGQKSLEALAKLPADINARFFAFCKISDLDFNTVAKKLKIKNSIKDHAEKCEAILFIDRKSDDFLIKTALEVAGADALFDVIAYKAAKGETGLEDIEKRAREIIKSAEPYKISDLKIGGRDLIALGYSGEEIGRILKELCDHIKKHPEDNKKDVLKNIITKRS